MKTITYTFVDGTKQTLEVSDEFYEKFIAIEKEQRNSDRRETRRHISLDRLMDNGFDIPTDDKSIAEMLLENCDDEKLQKAINKLLPAQKELLIKIFSQGFSAKDIAEKEGVDKSAISKRLSRIFEKIRKNLN